MAVRDVEKGRNAAAQLKSESEKRVIGGGAMDLTVLPLDVSSLVSVRAFVAELQRRGLPHVNLLINNAGVNAYSSGHRLSPETGIELTSTTNYVGPFLLTELLLPMLKAAPAPPAHSHIRARIVNVSSIGSLRTYPTASVDDILAGSPGGSQFSPMRAYFNSKQAQVLHALDLQDRVGDAGICAYSLHPGGKQTARAPHCAASANADNIPHSPSLTAQRSSLRCGHRTLRRLCASSCS
jgi:NAD(P)-dependent dehydrogenase (short-subunit alcohol dehydrogenase family)